MPKSSKRFILSNEKLNSHGFRVITSGIDITDFLKNPVMYWMHEYPKEGNADKGLPIGFWEDVRFNGDELSAIPVFDDNDDFAMKIYYKVEHGTIRAASVALDPIQVDANKSNWTEGQTKPTLLKSKLSEASIVDRGSNSDAVTLNHNSNNVYLKSNPRLMETSTSESTENSKQSSGHPPATLAIMNNAVAAGKFTQSEADKILSMTTNTPSVLSALKEIVKTTPIKPQNIEGKYHHILVDLAATKSYDEIEKTEKGGFIELKRSAPELYKAKFFEKHGRLPAVV
jgi:hypothetical protein